MEPSSHDSRRRKKAASKKRLMTVGWILIVLAITIIIVLLLTRGKTTVIGEYPGPERTSSLVCTKKGIKYPKITEVDSDDKTLSITAIFNGETELKSIALEYTLGYHSKEEVKQAEAKAHFEFGSHLGDYDFTEFDNKFSMYDDRLVVSVYGRSKDLEDENRAGYFMLSTESATKKDLSTLTGVRKAYEKKGFSCESLEDNK